jgi:hypothetical protein
MLAIHVVLVLRAGHYVTDRTIDVSVFFAFCALITAVLALVLKE